MLDAESKLGFEEFQVKTCYDSQAMKPISEAAVVLAKLIFGSCPSSSERTQAMIHIDQALMNAAAAIQRYPR